MASPTSVIAYRRRFPLDVSPAVIWASIEHHEQFETWWAWLREFRLEGPGLVDGAVLHGVVSPPLAYTMRLRVVLDHSAAPRRTAATAHADLEGVARLVLEPAGHGTMAEVSWTIEMKLRAMRLDARAAHPVMRS